MPRNRHPHKGKSQLESILEKHSKIADRYLRLARAGVITPEQAIREIEKQSTLKQDLEGVNHAETR